MLNVVFLPTAYLGIVWRVSITDGTYYFYARTFPSSLERRNDLIKFLLSVLPALTGVLKVI